MIPSTPLTYSALRRTLLELTAIDEGDFDPDTPLIDFGLDSIQVFDLIALWQNEGLTVDLAGLAREPTLNGWWRLIEPQIDARRPHP